MGFGPRTRGGEHRPTALGEPEVKGVLPQPAKQQPVGPSNIQEAVAVPVLLRHSRHHPQATAGSLAHPAGSLARSWAPWHNATQKRESQRIPARSGTSA